MLTVRSFVRLFCCVKLSFVALLMLRPIVLSWRFVRSSFAISSLLSILFVVIDMWALRDIKHGKTFHFDSLEDLIVFVKKLESV